MSTSPRSDEQDLGEFVWVVALVAIVTLSVALILGLATLGLWDAAWEAFLTVW